MTDIPPAEILLVEDNPHDVELLRFALEEAQLSNHLHVAGNGDVAMDFLHRRPPHESAPRPDIILLDLNMPGKDGREVLREVKADPGLRRIPVVVLTTSAEERDILRAYDDHVNAYVQKPVGFEALIDVAKQIDGFWHGIVKLAPDQRS